MNNMSNATKITGTDPEKPPITDDKSDTNVPGDNKGRGYEPSPFFVVIALIVLACTIFLASGTSYDYMRLILYILIMVLCAIIILRLGAVHWAFKIAVLIPFFWYLAWFLTAAALIWIFRDLRNYKGNVH